MLTSNFCTQFLVHSLVVACLSLTLMKFRENPTKGCCSGTVCFLFWYLFFFLVCWDTVQAGALSSYSQEGIRLKFYQVSKVLLGMDPTILNVRVHQFKVSLQSLRNVSGCYLRIIWWFRLKEPQEVCSKESQLWPFRSWKQPAVEPV